MFKVTHEFDNGQVSVFCTDRQFHTERAVNAGRFVAKIFKMRSWADRTAATYNYAMADYCKVVAA